MIVSGAGVDVGGEAAALAAHDQRELGVGLELDESVHHLHAGALEVAGPADVGLLVEPRLEFDQRGHRLSGLGRFRQRPHDRRVVRGAVQRLFDRDHVGVAGALLQELDDDVEGFIGVMDDQILLPDRREDIATVIAHAFRMARHIGYEFEVGPVEPRQLRQFVHRQHAIDQQNLVVRGGERALHKGAQFLRHLGFDFQADHRSAPPPLQRGLEQAHQIFGFFLDFEFGVADDPEGALTFDGIAGEQPADEQTGGLLQRDQPDRAVPGGRQADEAVDLAGHANERVHRLAVGDPRQMQRDGKSEARDERKRMRRIDRERRQQRENVVKEMVLDPGPLGFGDVATVDQNDADLRQDSAQIAPDRLLIDGEPRNRLVDQDKLFGGRQTVGAALRDALPDLGLDAGDPDHEELVKVIGRNRQKPDPLERGMAGIDRFLEHPAVEMQPGQLAVDEALRARPHRRADLDLHIFFFNYNSLCGFHQDLIQLRGNSEATPTHGARTLCYRDDVSMTLTFPEQPPSSC